MGYISDFYIDFLNLDEYINSVIEEKKEDGFDEDDEYLDEDGKPLTDEQIDEQIREEIRDYISSFEELEDASIKFSDDMSHIEILSTEWYGMSYDMHDFSDDHGGLKIKIYVSGEDYRFDTRLYYYLSAKSEELIGEYHHSDEDCDSAFTFPERTLW